MNPTSTQGIETLNLLKAGCMAAVLSVAHRSNADLRLQELGLIPGAMVEVLSQGEPMLIKVGELRLSLRQQAAEAVVISVL